MATTGGDDDDDPPTIVDQDEDQEEAISKVPADGDKDQGVGKRKRNPAGILRIDTSMAAASGSPRTSRRKSSAGSVLDYRFAATLNPADEKSPLPSADRLSVSFIMGERDGSSLGTSSVRMDSPVGGGGGHLSNQPHYLDIGDDEDDDEYSMSAQSILQHRRSAGGGRSSGRRRSFRRGRRPSSPFPGDEFSSSGNRRTSRGFSVATISSAEMNIPMDETGGGFNDQQGQLQLQQQQQQQDSTLEHVALHKEVVQNMRYQPWDMGRKLRVLRRAKTFVRQHEGALQQRLAESRNAKDIFARGRMLVAKAIQMTVREARNLISFLVPWEARIKEIESLFGSAVASYFTFLRWVFWINLVLTTCFAVFVVVPEVLATEWDVSGERKGLLPEERRTATDLQTLWDFEGILKYSPIFYGFYSNTYETNEGYKLPFAYFFTGLVLYMYSFVAILRKMAKNSRMAKLSDKEDECTFTWKLFTGWDYMIGHPETGENRRSAITLGFKEALLEEKEKERATEKLTRNVILRRIAANFLVLMLLCSSAYIVVLVVERSTEPDAESNWWRQNEITVILSLISIIFPNIFELIGIMEKYHPRRLLRWQLARIMILNLLNLYTLIFALFGKVNAMTTRLAVMKANISQQGLNLADLLEHTVTTPMMTPIFNATSESSVYYNVTDPILFVLNATENPVDMERYSTATWTTEPSTTTTEQPTTTTKRPEESCFQIMVDCATLETAEPTTTTTTTAKVPSTASEEVYDDEYDDDSIGRLKRQIEPIKTSVDPSATAKTTPKSLGLLLDSLNTILRNLKRNTTTSRGALNRTTRATAALTSTMTTTEAPPSTSDGKATAATTSLLVPSSTPELLDDLIRWHTAGLQLTTAEEDYENNDVSSSSSSIFDMMLAFNQTDPPTDSSSTQLPPELEISESAVIMMCPLVVCPWNDTVGYFSSLTTNIPLDEDVNSTSLCRGDNPQGCTPFWTSARDETVTSFHSSSSVHYSSSTLPATEEMKTTTPKPTLDPTTRLELRKLCWETMFGQELVKLTIMDLVFTTISILIIDFIRALFVRVFNGCWCWDLEKYFPQYGEFKIAENILHLVNNQGMIWMGMFFSPGLPAINIFKLFLLLYIRSWAVLTCNVPHEVIFRASRSNNFYLWLLLIMLFLCTLPVAYAIVWLEPSWHCGPFSDYARIFHVMTQSLLKATPESLHWVLSYIASPGVVIPLLVLLILVIYYLVSLSSSLREAVTDLRTQLRRERDAERLKTRQKKEEEAAKNQEQPPDAQKKDIAAEKIIAQWRKAVPFAPNKSQTTLPQTLAKEAVDKRRHQSGGGGGGGGGGRVEEQQQRAGPMVSSPPQPPVTAGRSVGRQGPTAGAVEAKALCAKTGPAVELFGCDGSDLDISDSLPNDNCSPVLTGRGPGPAAVVASSAESPPHHQPVYAVIKKKKKKKKSDTSPPLPSQRLVSAAKPSSSRNMTEAPRSPARIPLIRISQTESVEQAEKNAAPILDGPVDPSSAAARHHHHQQDGGGGGGSAGTGLVATSPTKSGALNLILQRAKERRAAAARQQQQQQPIAVSDSTADLVLNMEDTARESPTNKMEQLETLDSISDETPTITENQE